MEISIFETYNAGAVARVAAKDPQNQWMHVYNVTHAHLIRKSRKFSPISKGLILNKDSILHNFKEERERERERFQAFICIIFLAFKGSSIPSR